MTSESSWEVLAQEFRNINQVTGPIRADWLAYEGSENYGIWLLGMDGVGTEEAVAAFALAAARAIEKLGVAPIPPPKPREHCPYWDAYCGMEEEIARRQGRTIDLSDAVPIGLGMVDRDAVDPCSRAWLELLRCESTAFRSAGGTTTIGGKTYPSIRGSIPDICGISAVYCTRRARDEIGTRLVKGKQLTNISLSSRRTFAADRADSKEAPTGDPERRLSSFMQMQPSATYADIKYSAGVHTPEFQDWRKAKLKPSSVMFRRIEDVLSGTTPLKKRPPKQRLD